MTILPADGMGRGLEAVPDAARALCADWLEGLRALLGDAFVGLYLYGAITFPDGGPVQDIDYHVFLERPLTAGERDAIDALHRRLAADHPPLGAETDGYYITVVDARSLAAPRTQMWPRWRLPTDASWALHCAHVRAGRCIVLAGPGPSALYPEPDWPHLRAALFGEVRYVTEHVDQAPAFAVLNACRLLYSFDMRDVVTSKQAAGSWARVAFPPWEPVIELAERWYEGRCDESEMHRLAVAAPRFVAEVWDRIAGVRESDPHTP